MSNFIFWLEKLTKFLNLREKTTHNTLRSIIQEGHARIQVRRLNNDKTIFEKVGHKYDDDTYIN